ncbi:hypothetical protein ACFCV8_07860 [Streptomyces sp. NPDC056347]|uniref:hypothetical protein n=1 Tax=Streptomyces sp. NPDC056347 TaxID=3345790 RepID=UPI0035E0B249
MAKAGDSGLSREEAMGRLTPTRFEQGKTWIRDHPPPSTTKIVRNGRYTMTSIKDEEGEQL